MISSRQHCSDSGGQRTTIEVTGGGKEIPLNTIRSYGMEVPPSEALDMSESGHE